MSWSRRDGDLLGDVLGCPVSAAGDREAFFAELERRHCFDPGRQPGLTAAYLGEVAAGMPAGAIRELSEPFGIRLTLARTTGDLAVIGPYTDRALSSGEATVVLNLLRLPGSRLQEYRLYRARYAIVDSEYALRAAAALVRASGLAYDETLVEQVALPTAEGASQPVERPHLGTLEEVERRYQAEQEFMRAVADGDQRRAFAALRQMAEQTRQPAYLAAPYLGVTILRVLTRVGAQLGGLPPVTIDAISQTYAQRLQRTAHTRTAQVMPDAVAMVGEFCRHVRRYRQRDYSKLVRRVVDEIELDPARPVRAGELARRLRVSRSHLSRTFKAETGLTITDYSARARAERAAQLLSATDRPVGDIAAQVGYPDANYFVKVFRTVFETTPTAYRKQHSR